MPRRAFFSFHYQPDVWRAWNVRNCWIVKPDEQVADGFYDGSVFEAKQRTSDESLKNFLRDGLNQSSVTCVLTGSHTWSRRWVRYEIVRSVAKGNGLLVVDIDGVKDKDGRVSAKGANPLAQLGVYKTDAGDIYFAEWKNNRWVAYGDYTSSIPASDLWFAAPTDRTVVQLSNHACRYDFATQKGRENISGWIEAAARAAGR